MLRIFITLLAIGMLGGFACGGDDGSDSGASATQRGDGTPEADYFLEIQAIHADVLERIDANSEAYPGAFEGDLEDTKMSFPIYVELFDEFSERAADVEVPESVRELHDEMLAIDQATSVIHHQRAALLAEATTYAEVDEIFADDPEFTDLFNQSVAACERRDAVAEAHGVADDEECGE